MPETSCVILTPQSRVKVVAQTGGSIPRGLALTLVPLVAEWGDKQRAEESRWSITHLKSGKRVGPGFEERKDAQKVAEALYGACDWTLPAYALCAIPGIEGQVREILDRVLTELDEES